MPRSVIVRAGISGSGTVSSTAMIAASSTVFSMTPPMPSILHPFEGERDSLAHADAHGGRAELAAVALQLLGRGKRKPRAGHSERVAESDGPTVWVYAGVIIRNAQLAEDRQALRGEGFVQFDHVEVADLEAEALHQLLGGWRRADAHDPRRHPGDGGAEHSSTRCQVVASHSVFRSDDDCSSAVVDARRVAGGDGAVGADDRLELGERFQGGRTRMLVLVDDDKIALPLGN